MDRDLWEDMKMQGLGMKTVHHRKYRRDTVRNWVAALKLVESCKGRANAGQPLEE